MFQFISQVNECNDSYSTEVVNAWTNLTQSTFYFNTSIANYLSLRFECVLDEYNTNNTNMYSIPIINAQTSEMYSLNELITHINGQINQLSQIDQTNCIGADDLHTANSLTKMYISNDALNMDVNINRTFTNKHYTFTCGLFGISYEGHPYMYANPAPSGASAPPYDLSNTNVFYLDIPVVTNASHSLNNINIQLTPKNPDNPVITVPFSGDNNAASDMLDKFGEIFFAFQTHNRSIFTQSTYEIDPLLIDIGNGGNAFYIRRAILTVRVNLTLTAADYRARFVDTHTATDPYKNFWKHKMHIHAYYDMQQQKSYEDPTAMTALPSVAFSTNLTSNTITISHLSDLSTSNQITLDSTNHYVDFVSYPTDGLIGSVAETIRVTIPTGSYHYGTLLNQINTLLAANPLTKGSVLTYQTTQNPSYARTLLYTVDDAKYYTSDPLYIAFRMCVNQVYRTKDYRVVFYDPYSFVSCYTGATHVGSRSVQNVTWDTTVGWLLGFRNSTVYDLSVSYEATTNQTMLTSDTCISMNLYNYFLIMLDDYTQNHLNDGLVTITMQETAIEVPMETEYVCNPATGSMVVKSQANMTQSQVYADNQKLLSRSAQKRAAQKSYSNGPFVKDIFGLIPIKTSGFAPGSVYVEFGGTLQNQERTYFGPVNIHRMTIKLLTDRGDLVDLNNANWSFSFVCETLYRSKN